MVLALHWIKSPLTSPGQSQEKQIQKCLSVASILLKTRKKQEKRRRLHCSFCSFNQLLFDLSSMSRPSHPSFQVIGAACHSWGKACDLCACAPVCLFLFTLLYLTRQVILEPNHSKIIRQNPKEFRTEAWDCHNTGSQNYSRRNKS